MASRTKARKRTLSELRICQKKAYQLWISIKLSRFNLITMDGASGEILGEQYVKLVT